jgi:hypothetical protein
VYVISTDRASGHVGAKEWEHAASQGHSRFANPFLVSLSCLSANMD